jgi:hypothetical protein
MSALSHISRIASFDFEHDLANIRSGDGIDEFVTESRKDIRFQTTHHSCCVPRRLAD